MSNQTPHPEQRSDDYPDGEFNAAADLAQWDEQLGGGTDQAYKDDTRARIAERAREVQHDRDEFDRMMRAEEAREKLAVVPGAEALEAVDGVLAEANASAHLEDDVDMEAQRAALEQEIAEDFKKQLLESLKSNVVAGEPEDALLEQSRLNQDQIHDALPGLYASLGLEDPTPQLDEIETGWRGRDKHKTRFVRNVVEVDGLPASLNAIKVWNPQFQEYNYVLSGGQLPGPKKPRR